MSTKQELDEYQYKKLLTLGMEGKLWSVRVQYRDKGETKQHIRRNMLSPELMGFRKNMFQFGFEISVGPGHWKIVCPMDIEEVEMFKQTKYIPDGGTHIAGKPDQPIG